MGIRWMLRKVIVECRSDLIGGPGLFVGGTGKMPSGNYGTNECCCSTMDIILS